jgi:hypothetical protein
MTGQNYIKYSFKITCIITILTINNNINEYQDNLNKKRRV